MLKMCRSCWTEKPLADMVRDSRRHDGYSSRCKACLSAANTAKIDADRDRHNESRRTRHAADPRNSMLDNAKQRARIHDLPFSITLDDVVMPTLCPALGVPLAVSSKVSDCSPTLDKIIPALGYVPGNVVVVSHLANRIKSNATPAQLMAVARFYSKPR